MTQAAKPYDLAIFIGRFQPFHIGHEQNVKKAIEIATKAVVIVGSVGIARDIRNPFTFAEREGMIYDVFGKDNVSVEPLRDHPYNDTIWASYVQQIVDKHTQGKNLKVALVGHRKEDTSYYIDMFPQWDFVETEQTFDINATKLREMYFGVKGVNIGGGIVVSRAPEVSEYVSPGVNDFLRDFISDESMMLKKEFLRLRREWDFIEKYKKAWEKAPYAPTFVTVDAIVVQSGHVLMVKRRSAPGENLWAAPGGYLEQDETIRDGMIRELYEETKLAVPKAVIAGSIADTKVFDYPKRSLRGRIVTHAFLVKLKDGPLPKVKAASDAKRAVWIPINDFYKMQDQCFEDHFYLYDYFINSMRS